jgi:hypothetical protein
MLGVQQATVAKYERQNDLLISRRAGYVQAIGGKLKLTVEFPDRPPVALDGFSDNAGKKARRGKQRTASIAHTAA